MLALVVLSQFIKMVSHCGRIGNNAGVLQWAACLVVGPVAFATLLFSLIMRRWDGPGSMTVLT